MKTLNVAAIREEFPILQKKIHGHPLIYLDSAATSQKPKVVIDTLQRFYLEQYGTVHRAVYTLANEATQKYDYAREAIRKFLHARNLEEIIFTRGTTDGINLVASTYGRQTLKEKDEIIISETEHHSNIVPWQLLCEEKGAILKVAPVDDKGEIILEEFEKMLSHQTKIVSIAHIANATGTIHPIKILIELAHKIGAVVLVDGAQSAAHMLINVQDLDVDFFVFSGHKAYGPNGVGVLYGKKEILERLPPYQGGGDMIQEVYFEKTTFQPLPLKFEAGTPIIAEVIGLHAAIDYIEKLGRESIFAYEKSLLEYDTQKLNEVSKRVRIIGTAKEKGALITMAFEGAHSLDVATLLDVKAGIAVRSGHLCAQPTMRRFGLNTALRVSFGVYNTFEEVDQFIEHLKKVLRLL